MIEALIGCVLTLLVTGSVLGLLSPARGALYTQPEVSDVQQRMRVAVLALHKDLAMAGAGGPSGAAAAPLHNLLAPVMPYRYGLSAPDPPGTFRTDVITTIHVPPAAAVTHVARAADAGSGAIVETRPGCGGAREDGRCGFTEGMRVLLLEPGVTWDLATVTRVEDAALHVSHGGSLSSLHDAGDSVAIQVSTQTYSLVLDRAGGTGQLMQYDGDRTAMPVVDNVVAVQFRYWGDPLPPRLLAGPAGALRASYGPSPRTGEENCTFAIRDGSHVPRLATLGASGLVEITAAMAADGPWCPDPASAARFDADLVRIRRVGVTLRVQAAAAWFRGSPASLFLNPGTAVTAHQVPDQEVRFDVAPRNMNLRP